ncbi:hypothetical protein BDP27DRAFT_1318582 [Rhodocollybia butyracea]|uniref:Uncharacterized protein n=1 Tax=Rhodocollybia butyracea TaxID=206335 RepID=A0A9P5UC02_9AGAR|nr:hypothetical protein BDP27DRAFT_1318582 [Rhodocollybia butyracea]
MLPILDPQSLACDTIQFKVLSTRMVSRSKDSSDVVNHGTGPAGVAHALESAFANAEMFANLQSERNPDHLSTDVEMAHSTSSHRKKTNRHPDLPAADVAFERATNTGSVTHTSDFVLAQSNAVIDIPTGTLSEKQLDFADKETHHASALAAGSTKIAGTPPETHPAYAAFSVVSSPTASSRVLEGNVLLASSTSDSISRSQTGTLDRTSKEAKEKTRDEDIKELERHVKELSLKNQRIRGDGDSMDVAEDGD